MIDVKAFTDTLKGKPVAVFGAGISNIAAIKALKAAGADVHAWDDKPEGRKAAEAAGATLVDLAGADLSAYGCLVLAPGVPLTHPAPHPVVTKAQEAGIEIMCDLEILHRTGHGRKTIGVTGTNGKSTTTALIGHILNECGIKAAVGGNIGAAALDLDMPPRAPMMTGQNGTSSESGREENEGAFVLEISSFQADICPAYTPDITVLLNLTPDHIDRHGSMEGYVAAKKRLFAGEGEAVIAVDDDETRKLVKTLKEEGGRYIMPVSITQELDDGISVEGGTLRDMVGGVETQNFEMNIKTLPGVHNHQNAAAAYAVARLMGCKAEAIYEAMKTFPGLAHRQYLTRVINGVAYINDSKATNAAAAARALACYKNIYWILGGKPKDGDLDELAPLIGAVKHAFLIGEAMEEFGTWLDNHGVPHNFCQTLDRAVDEAHRMAQSERGQPGGTGTVLLSPACASFDQFKSFEERGDVFTQLVDDIKEEAA